MKKMVPWMIMILIAITLIALAAFVLWEYIMQDTSQDPNTYANNVETKTLSAEERSELTVHIDEITTNLADYKFVVRISFSFLLTNEEVKNEFEMIQDVVKARIIEVLADTNPEEIQGSAVRDELLSKIINLINPSLQKGKVHEVDITDIIITEHR